MNFLVFSYILKIVYLIVLFVDQILISTLDFHDEAIELFKLINRRN